VSLDVIQFFVQQLPESIQKPIGNSDMVAIHWACQNGASFLVIQFMAEQLPESVGMETHHGRLLHIACSQSRTLKDTIEYITHALPDSLEWADGKTSLWPLHLACQNHGWQNEEIIAFLLAKYPAAVRMVHWSMNRMPLHLACQEQASLAVLKLLVQAWPEAVKLPNENRFLPLHYACLEVASDAN